MVQPCHAHTEEGFYWILFCLPFGVELFGSSVRGSGERRPHTSPPSVSEVQGNSHIYHHADSAPNRVYQMATPASSYLSRTRNLFFTFFSHLYCETVGRIVHSSEHHFHTYKSARSVLPSSCSLTVSIVLRMSGQILLNAIKWSLLSAACKRSFYRLQKSSFPSLEAVTFSAPIG